MRHTILRFFQNSSGAVTVDWVVLTAAVVGLGISAAMSVATGTTDLGDNLGTFLETEEVFVQNN